VDEKESENDPFNCFRKREIRTSRKTRRTDAQCLQKLRQLYSEMESAKSIIEMIIKREKLKKEIILMEVSILEERSLCNQLKQKLSLPPEVVEEARLANKVKFSFLIKETIL
jgi:hypothetical protein